MSVCTRMMPGGGRITNSGMFAFNRYTPGSGINPVSYAIRRLKIRRASFATPIVSRPNSCESLTPINLSDIATPITPTSSDWILNADTTILQCYELTIPDGKMLLTNGFTLTNNGIINLASSFGLIVETNESGSPSKLYNNGLINATNNNDFGVDGTHGVAELINNGIIYSDAYVYCTDGGIITNNTSGRIINYPKDPQHTPQIDLYNGTLHNYGIIFNRSILNIYSNSIMVNYGTLYNTDIFNIYTTTTFTNEGTFNNSGTTVINNIMNNNGIIHNNSSIYIGNGHLINNKSLNNYDNLYIYSDGILTNYIPLTNTGIVHRADGTLTCGIGYINGPAIVTGIIDNVCPQGITPPPL